MGFNLFKLFFQTFLGKKILRIIQLFIKFSFTFLQWKSLICMQWFLSLSVLYFLFPPLSHYSWQLTQLNILYGTPPSGTPRTSLAHCSLKLSHFWFSTHCCTPTPAPSLLLVPPIGHMCSHCLWLHPRTYL